MIIIIICENEMGRKNGIVFHLSMQVSEKWKSIFRYFCLFSVGDG